MIRLRAADGTGSSSEDSAESAGWRRSFYSFFCFQFPLARFNLELEVGGDFWKISRYICALVALGFGSFARVFGGYPSPWKRGLWLLMFSFITRKHLDVRRAF